MAQNLLKETDLSPLHDAELYLVCMDRDKRSIQLGFRNVDRTVSKFSFTNTLTYRIDNVQSQNVVSRILISNISGGIENNLEKMAQWTCSAASRLLISADKFEKHLGKIRSGDLQLFYVDPSWGAEIGIIAEAVAVSHDLGNR